MVCESKMPDYNAAMNAIMAMCNLKMNRVPSVSICHDP